MIIPTTKETPWESSDAQRLREFLETESGKRVLSSLSSQVPSLLDGRDVNQTLVTSGEVKGWTAALEALISLMTLQPPQPKAPEAYPPLEDESQWADPDKPTK